MSPLSVENSEQKLDDRLPYDTPELVDRGDVSTVTQSTANGTGADGTYS